MAFPNPPYAGSCLCGSVKVRVTALPLLTLACHCRACQKFSASAYSLTTMFPKESFTCSGELVQGGLRSPGRNHYFCKSCMNFVYSRVGDASPRVNVRTSILDNASSFAPFVELMTKYKMPWVNLGLPRGFEEFPDTDAELQSLFDGYASFLNAL